MDPHQLRLVFVVAVFLTLNATFSCALTESFMVPSRNFDKRSSTSTSRISIQSRTNSRLLRLSPPSSLKNQKNSNENGSTNNRSAKVQFSSISASSPSSSSSSVASFTSPLDLILSLLVSDIGSIVLGLIGIVLLLISRSFLETEFSYIGENADMNRIAEDTRNNILAVLGCGSLLVNGISKLDVTSALAESVTLEGTQIYGEPISFVDPTIEEDANTIKYRKWALKSLLKATPAETAVLLVTNSRNNNNPWEIRSILGTVPSSLIQQQQGGDGLDFQPPVVKANKVPILDRFRKDLSKETYLPTLQALPGKVEFLSYLPSNTQEVLLLPVPTSSSGTLSALVLGSNCAKSFTPRDIAWCTTIAQRVGGKGIPIEEEEEEDEEW